MMYESSTTSRAAVRRATCVSALLLSALIFALSATGNVDAAVGDLAQKPGSSGCFSKPGGPDGCAEVADLSEPNDVAVSPDDRNVYVASLERDAILIFDRNPASGVLVQKAGTAGCVADTSNGGSCFDGRALDWVNSVTVSSDGKNVYATSTDADISGTSDGLVIFDRDPATGVLTQKAGAAGCFEFLASGQGCAPPHPALDNPRSVTVSPDGLNAYVAADRALVIFDRDPATGSLTKVEGEEGCISTIVIASCGSGRELEMLTSIAVSPDLRSVYVTAQERDAVATFDRAPASGLLTQKQGTAGCVSNNGSGGECQDGAALVSPASIDVSPDGKSVYVAAPGSGAVAILDRDPASGSLTQKPATAGCVSEDGSGGECEDGKALASAAAVTISPDGRSLYVADADGGDGGLAIFDRDPSSGSLTQKAGAAGCVLGDGSDGCQAGLGVNDAVSLAVSSEGSNLYAVSGYAGTLTVFDRDYLPPDTVITGGPGEGSTIADLSPSFGFNSDLAGSRFECRLDGGPFTACVSPFLVGPLAGGRHTFEVRAVHPRGKVDPSPAARSFTVIAGGSSPGTGPGSGPEADGAGSRAALRIGGRAKMNRKGVIRLTIRCAGPAAAKACRGRLSLVSKQRLAPGKAKPKRAAKSKRAGAKKRIALVKPKAFRVAVGKRQVLRLQLRPQARRALARQIRRGKPIPVIASANFADSSGTAPKVRRQVRVLPAKPAKRPRR